MKLGRNPSPAAPKLKLADFLDVSWWKPKVPENFGHTKAVANWGMLGNDRYGDCVWAGAAHEHMLWNAANDRTVDFTDDNVLQAYSDVTGFRKDDPNSDQGTDMATAARYRQKYGLEDSLGRVHKIGAYLALEPGDLDQLATATYLFGAVGIGIIVTDVAMDQFNKGKPWTYVRRANAEGGHYVPVTARQSGLYLPISWARPQPMSPHYYEKQADEIIAYVSEDYLDNDKSPEGFDSNALVTALRHVRSL
ncbi:hypothetical protein [Nocardia nova]|uniref:hypothetical protein n=1 Tax=Nocardia nova TaxID=37330 RepID=UPI002738B038|nr:hypothetical protein [Nocardia nova]